MLPTHALGGMALALLVSLVAPAFAGVALVAGLLGGIFPDLDMYVGHRKTLHYPTYYPLLAGVATPVMFLFPSAATVGVGVFLLAAAAHSVSDIFGGGLELRPWEATSDRAVYDHYQDRWHTPRHWVHYDGSPGDLLLSVGLAVPLLLTVDGVLRWVVAGTVTVAVVYAALRRVLPTVAERFLDVVSPVLSDRALAYVPARYVETRSERNPARR